MAGAADPRTESKKKIVLVIDDEKAVLNAASLILNRAGYHVLTAESGLAGCNMLDQRAQLQSGNPNVQLILVDWQMPGWDGMRVLNEIRDSAFKAIPIILMSGVLTREQLLKAAANKATSVLLKPLDKDVLLNKVADLIGPGASSKGGV